MAIANHLGIFGGGKGYLPLLSGPSPEGTAPGARPLGPPPPLPWERVGNSKSGLPLNSGMLRGGPLPGGCCPGGGCHRGLTGLCEMLVKFVCSLKAGLCGGASYSGKVGRPWA